MRLTSAKYIFPLIIIIILSNYLYSQTSKKILRWAADAESGAPYVYYDPSNPTELTGFEVDIIKAISDSLKMENRHFQNQWDGLILGLNRDDYDVIINGIEITEERKDKVDFSIPYFATYEQIVVRKDQEGIDSLEDLKGKKVGTLKGALAEEILNSVEGIIIRTYDSEYNSFTDLKLGRLDAVFIDAPVAIVYAKPDPELKLVGKPVGKILYGIVSRKGDPILRQIDSIIRVMTCSGDLRNILKKWDLWEPNMWIVLMEEHTKGNVLEKEEKKEQVSTLEKYIKWIPELINATLLTLSLSVVAMIFAIIFGLIIAITRVFAPKPLSSLAVAYIEAVRGTPLLLQLFFIYYIFPHHLGLSFIPPFFLGVLALGLNYAAYEAENYRAGLFAVPRGQIEAALSLGMTKRQALRYIILPQAIRIVIPPITNDFISLLKDSSLVSVIAMVELTKAYGKFSSSIYEYILPGIIVAGIYLLIGLPFVRLAKYAEKKATYDKRKKFRFK